MKAFFNKYKLWILLLVGIVLIVICNVFVIKNRLEMQNGIGTIIAGIIFIVLVGPALILLTKKLKITHQAAGTIFNFIAWFWQIGFLVITVFLIFQMIFIY